MVVKTNFCVICAIFSSNRTTWNSSICHSDQLILKSIHKINVILSIIVSFRIPGSFSKRTTPNPRLLHCSLICVEFTPLSN